MMQSNVSKNIFSQVVGHQATIANLLTMVRSQRVPNSLLFVGPSGQGKKRVAMGFAQAIVCEQLSGELQAAAVPCGVCPACVRVERGQSENLILLEPEKGQIKIEEARNVIRQLSLTTIGRGRLVVIDDAQLLNPQAANALLKVIEEPPEKTFFVLISPSQESVLKTLRSRSQVVRFRSLTRDELTELQRSPVDQELREKALKLWQLILTSDSAAAAIEFAREQVDSRELGLQMVHMWFEFTRDQWVMSQGEHALLHSDLREPLQELNQSLASGYIRRLAQLSEDILSCERDLIGHCEVQLTLENFVHQAQGLRSV